MTSAAPAGRRPNIVFILSDDHAAHAISAYGSVVNTTPHIDAIGEAGVRFENLFATNSLCAPSRASILTGTYSHVNGVTHARHAIDAASRPSSPQLRDAGYRTGFVGKWHMGDGETDGVSHDPQGFDYWDAAHRPGRVPRPAVPLRRRAARRARLRHRPHHRPRDRAGWSRSTATTPVVRPGLAQGTAPALGTGRRARRHVRGPPIPVPAHLRPTTSPTRSDIGASGGDAHRRPPHRGGPEAARPARTLGRRGGAVEVPALHGGLPRLRGLRRRQRRPASSTGCASAATSTTPCSSTRPTRASSSATTAGSTSGSCTRSRSGCRSSCRYPRAVAAGQMHDGIVTNVDVAQTLLDAAGVPAAPADAGPLVLARPRPEPRDRDPPAEGCTTATGCTTTTATRSAAHYGYRTDRYSLIYFYNDGLGLPGCSDARVPGRSGSSTTSRGPGRARTTSPTTRRTPSVRTDLERRLWRAQASVGDVPHPEQPRPH